LSVAARIRAALTTWPAAKTWGGALLELPWLGPVLVALGLAGGFVGAGPAPDPPVLIRIAAIALISPAFAEELFFRALLVGPASSLLRCAVGIALFVAWHPLQAMIFGERWAEIVFNPFFLCAAAVLGIAMTRVYLRMQSIWPPVVLHWLVVIAWKLAGGPSPWG
jgi:predicted Abi (CAAX) family protease